MCRKGMGKSLEKRVVSMLIAASLMLGSVLTIAQEALEPLTALSDYATERFVLATYRVDRRITNSGPMLPTYRPQIGVYDNTEPRVIRYHMDLAQSMGIILQADLYGSHVRQPEFDGVFEEMLNIAEEQGTKVSIMYEPQTHWKSGFCNCGHDSRPNPQQHRIDAVINDLKHYLRMIKIKGREHLVFKYQNKPVITVFDVHGYGLKGSDWIRVKEELNSANLPCVLIGDYPGGMAQNNNTAFNGAVAWTLVYKDFLEGLERGELNPYSWCIRLNEENKNSWGASGMNRFGVAIVYPGFNEGREGWEDDNGRATLPRKILNPISGQIYDREDFYEQSWEAALKSGFNIVQIATFNDFPEGTNIEPDRDKGYALGEMTVDFVNKFRGGNLDRNEVRRITEEFLSFNCGECKICKSGRPSRLGRILGETAPTIFDVLEILKNIVGMDNTINKCGNARTAALITAQSKEEAVPSIFDALEILKYLVGMDGVIGNGYNGTFVQKDKGADKV